MTKLKIFLTKGKGEGVTKESAYCEALNNAGLINLNLIKLTSVLPHNCEVINKKPKFSSKDYGKKLYVIMSKIMTSKASETVCAGLGWTKKKNGAGYGLVVQIEGPSKEKVEQEIRNSLNEIAIYGKNEGKKKMNIVTEEITCKNKPVCVLVVLAFNKIEGWNNPVRSF